MLTNEVSVLTISQHAHFTFKAPGSDHLAKDDFVGEHTIRTDSVLKTVA